MTTITYDALNDLVHEIAEAIEKTTGLGKETMLDLLDLNDNITSYLDRYGVQYVESLDNEPSTAEEAINNIKQAIRVIAPICDDMRRFGHSQADDVSGAQADLEQAVRFLNGEEVPA